MIAGALLGLRCRLRLHRWEYSEDRQRRVCPSCRRAEADWGGYWMQMLAFSLSHFLHGGVPEE